MFTYLKASRTRKNGGAAAGLVPGLIYSALEKKNRWAATICAAAAAPIVNTGIFLLGCLAFFMGTINEWAAGAGIENAGVYMVTVFVGVNFLVELGANLLLSSQPAHGCLQGCADCIIGSLTSVCGTPA